MRDPAAEALARRVTEAHGGLDAWQTSSAHTVHFSSGGLAFTAKGQPRTLSDVHGTFATGSQQIALRAPSPAPWTYAAGNSEDLRADISRLATGHRRFRWMIDDIAAFAAAAMWTYLNLPFVLHEPDVELRLLDTAGPLERLAVHLPRRCTSHAVGHVLHIDPDGRIQRHDYTANSISHLATASQHLDDYTQFGNIKAATSRRVVPRFLGKPLAKPTLVWIKIHDIGPAADHSSAGPPRARR